MKDLRPAEPLADNVERIVRVRLDELCGFMPGAADPAEVAALHDMRIAAKRLRYILEITHSCFGGYAVTAVRHAKDLQDLLGEIHDCDVQTPWIQAELATLIAVDGAVLAEEAAGAADLPASAAARAPGRGAYAGLVALLVHLHARREVLFRRFLVDWHDLERAGFRARLEYALSERPGARDGAGIAAPAPPGTIPS